MCVYGHGLITAAKLMRTIFVFYFFFFRLAVSAIDIKSTPFSAVVDVSFYRSVPDAITFIYKSNIQTYTLI